MPGGSLRLISSGFGPDLLDRRALDHLHAAEKGVYCMWRFVAGIDTGYEADYETGNGAGL